MADRWFRCQLDVPGQHRHRVNAPGLCPGDAGSNPARLTVWNGFMPGRTMLDPSAQAGIPSIPPGAHEPLNPNSKSADTGKDA